MKQLLFTYKDEYTLDYELRKLRKWYKSSLCSAVLIHIFTEILDRDKIETACQRIKKQIPDAVIVGSSSSGNITNGEFKGGEFAVVCTLFEFPSTRVEMLQYTLTAETVNEVVACLKQELKKRPWVKGVEMLLTIRGMSMTALCEGLSDLPKRIQIFGGGAFSGDLEKNEACIFSAAGGYSEKGIIFVLLGGEDFHLKTTFLTGWKPLGLYLDVTGVDGEILRSLNGRPAYEIYNRYLNIKNDESFFYNTLEFPFLYHANGIDIMRAPIASLPDGSLVMTSDISHGVKARIAYGDPWTILDSVWQEGNRLLEFSPECISVYSCAARRTFWGNAEVGKETEPYQIVAPTSGFYTSSEFVRTNGFVNQHNVTQVLAAMREGDPKPQPEQEIKMGAHIFEGKVSMINRMATFIKATSEELTEANRRLSEIAITDAMTGLGNKTAYLDKTRELEEAIQSDAYSFAVVVFDMNGLKRINDNFGHEYGDMALKDAARVLTDVFGKTNLYRIGGDEFIAVMNNTTAEEMEQLFGKLEAKQAEENRVEKAYKMPLTLSKGYSVFIPGMKTDYKELFRRADDAMYQDKTEYYRIHGKR